MIPKAEGKKTALTLTRKYGESIIIEGGITVTVLKKVGSAAVSVRIEAPPSVKIIRKELEVPEGQK